MRKNLRLLGQNQISTTNPVAVLSCSCFVRLSCACQLRASATCTSFHSSGSFSLVVSCYLSIRSFRTLSVDGWKSSKVERE